MADAKITALTGNTTPELTDILPMVDDPAGTPVTKKITVSDLLGARERVALCSGAAITSTSLVDIAGMSIPLTPGTWVFEMLISANAATGTNGAKYGVGFSGTASSVLASFTGQTSGTAFGATALITALSTGSTTVHTTSAAQGMVRIFGKIVVTASGNLTAQGLKVTSQTLNVSASSFMRAYKIS